MQSRASSREAFADVEPFNISASAAQESAWTRIPASVMLTTSAYVHGAQFGAVLECEWNILASYSKEGRYVAEAQLEMQFLMAQ
jgi:hypothetical protein